MRLVVLDGHTLNPGDLSWEPLEIFGEVKVYPRTPNELVVERALGAEVLLTNKTVLDRECLKQLPQLQYIGVTATGYNIVDVATAKERSITVTNIPGYGTESVAQHTFALILELANQVGKHSLSVNQGKWSGHPDWSFRDTPLTELKGKTLGIIGFGKIGKKVAQLGICFGMNIVVYNKHPKEVKKAGFSSISMYRLFEQSDIVTLHCPLTNGNHGFVNNSLLSRMKSNAFLINTARGLLINEHDLAEALNQKTLSGAGLDVLSVEPPSPDNPLIGARNCIITPHNAWGSLESRTRLLAQAVDNLKAFLNGEHWNVVS